MRLTRWEGRDEDGPRAVLVKRDGPFAPILQEALRKLARYEDEEDAGGASPSPTEDGGLIMITSIEKNFTYHAPKPGQPERYEIIRNKVYEAAAYINGACPDSREKSLAMTKLEEAVMWANASIARNE